MSKDGPQMARWVLSIMVDTVMRTNPHIREYYQHHKKRMGSGSLAHVKAMRKYYVRGACLVNYILL